MMFVCVGVLVSLSFAAPKAPKAKPKSPGVVYMKRKAAGVQLQVIQADIRRPDVNLAVVTAGGGIGTRESWSALIDRARPVAAITGTYFDTVSGIPIGSIGVGGKTIHKGFIGTAFSYSPSLGASIQYAPPLARFEFAGAEMWLRAGPRLLTNGRTTLYPYDEGFRDPAVFMNKKRAAVAITKSGKLLLVTVPQPVSLRRLAAALKGIGAVDAMCLDGGDSTGLYYRGKTRLLPRRPLTNLLVVYETVERYRSRLVALNR